MPLPLPLQWGSLGLLAAAALGQTGEKGSPGSTHVVFHESPAIDVYLLVRARSAPSQGDPSEGLRPAVEAARALDRALGGSPLAWAPLDGLLPGCTSTSDLVEAFGRAPESLRLRGGSEVQLRPLALDLAHALEAIGDESRTTWSEHAPRIAAVREQWKRDVGAHEAELFAFHLRSLEMDDPHLELPVHLVGEAPWPGAVTVRGENGRGVSFVGANAAEGSALLEVILHETTHSLDLAAGDESILGALRERLAEAGIEPRDRRLFDIPHALMFVQSAESIRRVIAPEHRDYGELEGVYERLGPAADVVRGIWCDRLDGKLTRDEALDAMVEGVLEAAPGSGR